MILTGGKFPYFPLRNTLIGTGRYRRASYRRRKSVSVNMPVAFTIYRPHRPVNYTEYTGYAGNIHRVHRVHRVHRSGRIYSRIRNRNVDRRTQINLGLQHLFSTEFDAQRLQSQVVNHHRQALLFFSKFNDDRREN